jgi:hypothetical protein
MIKKFKLGAKEFNVELVHSIDDTGLGRTYSMLNKIKISKTWQNYELEESSKDQTFYHELVHAILDELGEHELSQNERFVQSFSVLLYQFEKTKE